jgi:hypothetical protein
MHRVYVLATRYQHVSNTLSTHMHKVYVLATR